MARGPEGGVRIAAGRSGGIGVAAGRSFGGAPRMSIGGAERSASAALSGPRLTIAKGLGSERSFGPKNPSVLNKQTVRTVLSPRLDTDSSPRLHKSQFSRPGVQNTFRPSSFRELSNRPATVREKNVTSTRTSRLEGLRVIPQHTRTKAEGSLVSRLGEFKTPTAAQVREGPVRADNVRNSSVLSTTLPNQTRTEKSVLSGRRFETQTINSWAVRARKASEENMRGSVPTHGAENVRIVPFDKKPINSERVVQQVRSEIPNSQPTRQEVTTAVNKVAERKREAITSELRVLSAQQERVIEEVKAAAKPTEHVSSVPVSYTKTDMQAVAIPLPDEKVKTTGAAYGNLLKKRVQAITVLQDETQKAEATKTLRVKLRKVREKFVGKIKNVFRVSVVPAQITTLDVQAVMETEDEKRRKKLLALQQSVEHIFQQRVNIVTQPELRLEQQINITQLPKVESALRAQMVTNQDVNVYRAVQAATNTQVGQENQEAVALKIKTVTSNEVKTQQDKLVQKITKRGKSVVEAALSIGKNIEFFISKPTLKNRLDSGRKGIWLSFTGTDKDKVAADKILENIAQPSVPTTSPILLKHGIGDAVEAQKLADPTDVAWRQEFAGQGELTQKEAQEVLVFIVEKHKPVDAGDGNPRASEEDVEKVVGKRLISQPN